MGALDANAKIGDLTVVQFADLIEFKGDRYRAALAEQERVVSDRIFADAEGLRVATAPFRVSNNKEVDAFAANLKRILKDHPGCQVVVAMGLANSDGKIDKMPWEVDIEVSE